MTGIKTGGETIVIEQELTVTTAAYTAGDVVGGLLTFSSDAIHSGIMLNAVVLIDEDSQAEAYSLYLFDGLPTTIANDAAFAPTIADLRKLVKVVTIAATDYTTVNSLDYARVEDLNDLIPLGATGAFYGYLVATDTPDYTNTDTLYIRLIGLQP